MSGTREIPPKTAELAHKMPGAGKLLAMGVDVLHYEDRRDQEAAQSQEHEVPEVGRLATHRRVIRSAIMMGEIDPYSPRMEP